ncbi:uncharacterized protein LOC133854566 [Alnus glutinosa]|uniref:uncharacterized protein LOC133854566 n=1 Tax=Alnus glutinosa TaxID=3517 RepID=UPI002D77B310|nr:uncharacterized protein LOC133854566 [Alnus glutinosa]
MEDCSHNKYWGGHHLIYREELKKDGEKKVHCSCCYKPIWGSLHNCVECQNRPVHRNSSSSENHFLDFKEKRDPVHRNSSRDLFLGTSYRDRFLGYSSGDHFLDFKEKLENDGDKKVVCYWCNEPVLGPAYKCRLPISACSFVVHKSCTDLSQINHPLHPHHTLTLRKPGINCCDACRRSHDRSFFYKCDPCDFQLDIECANRLPVNPNDCHHHDFFSVFRQIQFSCDACGKEIKHMAYKLCNICKLLVHNTCAKLPPFAKFELHNHILSLIYSPQEFKKRDDIFCKICCNNVNTEYAAYYCRKCNYIIHIDCLTGFTAMYTAYSSLPTTSESVPSKSTHLIRALNQSEDEGPHLEEIQHFSHRQHKLILCNDEVKDDKLCQGCMEFIISVPFYSCVHCNFFLHTRCSVLPTKIQQYRLHNFHQLTLLSRANTKGDVFFCELCSRGHCGFTYKCDNCSTYSLKQICVQCGSIPDTLKHEGHQHSLFLALRYSNRKCKACPKDNENYVFVCTSCDFALGIRCANLPLLARHKCDTHFLKLTYAAENAFGEYYCLICEKERDPNYWFYYCAECDFPAHIECVLGNNPCITIGSTYNSDYHQHPLTCVKKTKNQYCHGCHEAFDDVALECSKCHFSVHLPRPYFRDCMWQLSEWGW